MTILRSRLLVPVIAPALIALASGCASTTPPTHFYVLSAEQQAGAAPGANEGPFVGVGPVELPTYLDRPELVTRSSRNELELAEFDQWAEPLKDSFSEVLADNLAHKVPTQHVAIFPWKRAVTPDLQVIVDVSRFEATASQGELRARWSVISASDDRELIASTTSHSEPVRGNGPAAQVAALNRALAVLSNDIATALQSNVKHARKSSRDGAVRRSGDVIAQLR